MPRPVRVCTNAGVEEASRWLAESLGTMHIKRDGDVIEILRVAVVGNRKRAWQALAEKLISRFIDAETRFFDGADHALAEPCIRP